MQALTIINKNQFMSSKEIAKLTGKQHKTVLRDIRNMFDYLENQEGTLLYPENYQVITLKNSMTGEIKLNHDLTITLLTGYSVVARYKVIKRWQELENEKINGLLLIDKRQSHLPMMNALVEHRAELGKETKQHHFMNENRLCNWAVTGSFDAIDESSLTVDQLQLLAYARRTNESLIMADIEYDERKRMLAYNVENKRRKLVKLLS
jgi:phage regulator Rha-like protein